MLHRLEAPDRAAELPTLFHVGEHRIEARRDGTTRVTSRARVVRVARDARDAGMGIAFVDMTDADRAAVRAYFTQL